MTELVRKNAIARISTYNLLGPVEQNEPNINLPSESRVTEPSLYPSLLTYAAAPRASDISLRERDLRRTLQFLRDWEDRAKSQGDKASLLCMALALSGVELERIVHEA